MEWWRNDTEWWLNGHLNVPRIQSTQWWLEGYWMATLRFKWMVAYNVVIQMVHTMDMLFNSK